MAGRFHPHPGRGIEGVGFDYRITVKEFLLATAFFYRKQMTPVCCFWGRTRSLRSLATTVKGFVILRKGSVGLGLASSR